MVNKVHKISNYEKVSQNICKKHYWFREILESEGNAISMEEEDKTKHLNPLDQRIWQHWSLLKAKLLEESKSRISRQVFENNANITAGRLSNDGYFGSFTIQRKNTQRLVKNLLRELERLCDQYNLNPDIVFKGLIEKEIFGICNPKRNFDIAVEHLLPNYKKDGPQQERTQIYEFQKVEGFAKRDLKIFWMENNLKHPKKMMVFISSWQQEFSEYRALLRFFIEKDIVLGRFYDVFVFEKTGAPVSTGPEDAYVYATKNCDLYLGLFGTQLRPSVKKEYEAAEGKEVYLFQDKRKEPEKSLKEFKEAVKDKKSWYEFDEFEDLLERVREVLLTFAKNRNQKDFSFEEGDRP